MTLTDRGACEAGFHSWTRGLQGVQGTECVVRTCDHCGRQEICWAPVKSQRAVREVSARSYRRQTPASVGPRRDLLERPSPSAGNG